MDNANTLFIRGLPYSVTNERLMEVFSNYGDITSCFVVLNKYTKQSKGIGYVKYGSRKECDEAMKHVREIDGRKVSISPAGSQSDINSLRVPPQLARKCLLVTKIDNLEIFEEGKVIFNSGTCALVSFKDRSSAIQNLSRVTGDGMSAHLYSKHSLYSNLRSLKSFRLIIHNLPFSASVKDLSKVFSACGDIVEIVIPRNGTTSAGFGFVQFTDPNEAELAIERLNGQKIMGRVVAVDYSLSQEKYKNNNNSLSEGGSNCLVEESVPKVTKSDTDEQRTVFLRNLGFDVTEEKLREVLVEYVGDVVFVRCVVRDGACRGTAFVKFREKEGAEKCLDLAKSGQLSFEDRALFADLAVNRDKVGDFGGKSKETERLDKRNLFLVREGMIRLGTKMGESVPEGDMKKRHKLEVTRRMKLKDDKHFVSPTRLTFHNLGGRITSKRLRSAILENVKDCMKSQLTECRVIMNKEDERSMGYAFVEFREHSFALSALRFFNNNETVFGGRRPIVQFAVENRNALLAKERQKARAKGEQLDDKQLLQRLKERINQASIPAKQLIPLNNDKFVTGLPRNIGPKKRRHSYRDRKQMRRKIVRKLAIKTNSRKTIKRKLSSKGDKTCKID